MKLKTNEFIKRYFDDDLSNEELELFREKLQTDIKFKEEVELYEQVFGDLVYAREQKMKTIFNYSEFQIHTIKSKQFSFLMRSLKIFILLLFLFIVFLVFILNSD